MRTKELFAAAALFMGLSVLSVFPVCAAETTVPDAKLREEADGLDISNDVEGCYTDIERLYDEGVRLFDTAGLLTADEKDSVEQKLHDVSAKAGFDLAIVTATDISGYERTMEFADDIFYYSDMGTGESMDGALLVMETYGSGSAYISTSGTAVRYLTDAGIDYVFDEVGGNGGVWSAFQSGDYYGACTLYTEGAELLYNEGIRQDQYNENESGEQDYYYEQEGTTASRHGISFTQIIISAVIALLAGFLPVNSIKRSYAMKDTAAARGGINNAYMAVSSFAPTTNVNAVFINKVVTRTPIPKPKPSNGGGHGGGVSHTHSGGGGHSFGGGGRGGR